MAAKTKSKEATPVKDESVTVASWRQEQFVKVLREAGMTDEEIDLEAVMDLVGSKVSHWDLRDLILKGCKPETAIEILV